MAYPLLVVYHNSALTSFESSLFGSKEALSVKALMSSFDADLKKFFKISPCFLFINIAGISIPAPVPSSERIISVTSSFLVSIIIANAPPALYIFLV